MRETSQFGFSSCRVVATAVRPSGVVVVVSVGDRPLAPVPFPAPPLTTPDHETGGLPGVCHGRGRLQRRSPGSWGPPPPPKGRRRRTLRRTPRHATRHSDRHALFRLLGHGRPSEHPVRVGGRGAVW
uniref:Uncharacterized protein n=1 Tax=Ixodes ricinus TaxID=34613 RepID=A0A0K8RI68_IXORI